MIYGGTEGASAVSTCFSWIEWLEPLLGTEDRMGEPDSANHPY